MNIQHFTDRLQVGLSRVCPRTGMVEVAGESSRLRPKELQLICYFHAHAGKVVSRSELLAAVWNWSEGASTRTVDQTVATLRRKLGNREHLRSVYGIGYRLSTAS